MVSMEPWSSPSENSRTGNTICDSAGDTTVLCLACKHFIFTRENKRVTLWFTGTERAIYSHDVFMHIYYITPVRQFESGCTLPMQSNPIYEAGTALSLIFLIMFIDGCNCRLLMICHGPTYSNTAQFPFCLHLWIRNTTWLYNVLYIKVNSIRRVVSFSLKIYQIQTPTATLVIDRAAQTLFNPRTGLSLNVKSLIFITNRLLLSSIIQ